MTSSIVSIIIPSFDREILIRETLDSVLKQTYPFWEAIVVDDGSMDKTCEVVQSYADRDQRIKLIKRNRLPKSASVCRNIGIENAKGQYIIFLDSDDLLATSCLSNRVSYMKEHPELDYAVFQMSYFNDKGTVRNIELVRKRDNYLYAYLRHDLPWNITCPIWNAMFVKEQLKGYDERYPRLQDPEFNTRALLVNNVKFEVLPESEADCYCRIHSAKMFSIPMLLSGFKLYIEEFSQRIKKLPDYKECKLQLKQGYIEAVRSFYSYYKPEWQIESIRMLREINKFALNDGLIRVGTYHLTRVLLNFYRMGLAKSKSGKYVLRIVMKLIKMS